MGRTEGYSGRPEAATLTLDESPVPETPQPAATSSDPRESAAPFHQRESATPFHQRESITPFHQRESITPFDQLDPTSTPAPPTPPPTHLPQPHCVRPRIALRILTDSSSPLAQRVTPDLSPSPASHSQPRIAYLPVRQPARKRTASLSNSPDPIDHGDSNDQPSHHTWVLDERHPKFLCTGQEFLLSVPGGEDWQELLSRYVEFEGLAPFVSFFTPYSLLHR